MSIPSWVKDAIFYQIFPDRFANGDLSNDPVNVQPWGTIPTVRGFQGGDLRGITQKLDYLTDLGINAIYLNPIFASPSTHRYNTTDYFQIDPKLGTLADFHTLIQSAHAAGIRVILDGVFNHCGRGFFAFHDILENEADSPYLNWFHVHRTPVAAYSSGTARRYAAWWGIKSLPKFNTGEPAVRRYLLDVSRYWIEQGADGWRLDVPNEIDDDSFWAEFADVVARANPEAYTLGEIWDVQPRWVGEGHFHGLMHYPVRTAVLAALTGTLTAADFANRIEELRTVYPPENMLAQYLLLGSHDTERIFTLLDGHIEKIKTAFLFQFACSGAPAIYYGDEIGLPGAKDPDCRRAFPWDESAWNLTLREHARALIAWRKASPALRSGGWMRLYAQDTLYAFARILNDDIQIVILNLSDQPAHAQFSIASLPGGQDASYAPQDFAAPQSFTQQDGQLSIEMQAWGAAILSRR